MYLLFAKTKCPDRTDLLRALTSILLLIAAHPSMAQCDGDGYRAILQRQGTDILQQSVLHTNGDIYVAGFSNGFSSNYDLILARYAPGPSLVWAKRYHTVGDDGGMSITLATGPSGAIYIGGTLNGTGTSEEDGSLVKLDADGVVQWARRILPMPYYCQVRSITEVDNGDVLIVGSVNSIGAGNADAYVARFGSAGDLHWLKSYGWGGQDHVTDIHAYPDGSFIAFSTSMGTSGSTRKGFLFRGDASGTPLSCALHGGGSYEMYNRGCRNADGTYLAVGTTQSAGAGGRDVIATLTDATGNITWSAAYGTSVAEEGLNAVEDGAGGWFIAAYQGTQRSAYVLHIDPDGMLLSTHAVGGLVMAQLSLWCQPLTRLPDGRLLLAAAAPGGMDAALQALDACGGSGCGSTGTNWTRTPMSLLVQQMTLPVSESSTNVVDIPVTVADVTLLFNEATTIQSCSECDLMLSGAGTSICVGEEVVLTSVLTGQPSGVLDWTWDLGDGSAPQSSATATHTYESVGQFVARVNVIDEMGCDASLDLIVDVNGPARPDLGPDQVVCEGAFVMLEVEPPAGTTYVWSDGSTDGSILVSGPAHAWVEYTLAGCTLRDSIFIDEQPIPPLFSLGPDLILCPDETFVLSTDVIGQPHTWQDGSTSTELEVRSAGVYWVTVGEGCTRSDTMVVEFVELPTVDLGPDTILCESGVVELDVIPGPWTILWQDGTSSPSITVEEAGNYWVIVEEEGCVRSDSINVSAEEQPVALLGADVVSCDGVDVSIQPVAFEGTLTWSNGVNTPSIMTNGSGTYWLQAHNACGVARDSIDVMIVPELGLDLGNDTTMCRPVQLLLTTGHPEAVHIWQDGTDDDVFMVSEPGVYTVTLELHGCQASDQIVVLGADPPFMTLPGDTTLCGPAMLLIHAHASDDAIITWQDSSVGDTHLAPAPGLYTATAMNGCGSVTESMLIEQATPLSISDQMICSGQVAHVSFPQGTATGSWSTGSVDMEAVFDSGTYGYAIVDVWGCAWSGEFVVYDYSGGDGGSTIPNVFTPNGDGRNDTFGVLGSKYSVVNLEVFNRWGQKLWSSEGDLGWDGTFGGLPVPEGTYFYVLTYQDRCGEIGQFHTVHGHVTLLR